MIVINTKRKTISDGGKFKEEIQTALYMNTELRNLLIKDSESLSAAQRQSEFKKYVFSHLFVDDTIEETASFIFYDVYFPYLKSNVKGCRIIMYVICHRDILDNICIDGYYGNRADILSQMVEDALINDIETALSFGIGKLELDKIDIYNANRFYGRILTFDVPTFR